MIFVESLICINSNDTMALLSQLSFSGEYDFITHIGDISYADDRDLTGNNPYYFIVYDEWGNDIEPVMSSLPHMFGPGNHEVSCHSWVSFFFKDFVLFFNQF